MRKICPNPRRALTLAVMAGLSFQAAAQDASIEEVIVTGSYIKGSPLDAPSPVTTIDRDSIESQGASGIWDLIRNLDVNQGSDTSTAGTNDAGQLTGTASVNLRNLGGNSTLTLINGKRFTPRCRSNELGSGICRYQHDTVGHDRQSRSANRRRISTLWL